MTEAATIQINNNCYIVLLALESKAFYKQGHLFSKEEILEMALSKFMFLGDLVANYKLN